MTLSQSSAVAETATELFTHALNAASHNAEDVDRHARFPSEAIEHLRAAGALSWYVPRRLGGEGAPVEKLADATFELSRRCAAAGMIFAMHQIQVGCIVHHSAGSLWFENYLRRLVSEQRLIASATSEAGVGGDLRRSLAAILPASDDHGATLRFEKAATTISYGAYADDLLTTLRCGPDAEPGDQVLVLTHVSDMEMKQTGMWDTLGMRGTCSPGFAIKAGCHPGQILPEPFSGIAAETMVPFSHILWAHVWLGISTEAYSRAQNFVRAQARQAGGGVPPSGLRLSELSVRLAQFRALVQSAVREYTGILDAECRAQLSTVGYAVRINNLKVAASEAAVDICQGALRICGFGGYANTGPYSVARQLRDSYSAALMIANDRLRAANAALLLVHREGR